MIIYEPNSTYPYSGGVYRVVEPAMIGAGTQPLQIHCYRCGEPLPTGGCAGHICRLSRTA